MEPSRSARDLEAIADGLERVTGLMVRHLSDRNGPGITAVSVLARLSMTGPLRLTALAAAEGISQPSMTQLIQRLARHDLVTRITDPEDRRVALIAVTDTGRAYVAARRRNRRDRLAELLASVPEADRDALALALSVATRIITPLNAEKRPENGKQRPEDAEKSVEKYQRTERRTHDRDRGVPDAPGDRLPVRPAARAE